MRKKVLEGPCYDPEEHGSNCGKCYACWKTIIPLDIMGKLDRFGESFDLNKYRSDRKKYSEILYVIRKDRKRIFGGLK